MANMKNVAFAVVMEVDGEAIEVKTIQADYIQWDITAHKHKWPDVQAAPFLWSAFTAWAAMRRQKLTDLGWDAFRDQVQSVQPVGMDEVDPTQQGQLSA